MVNRMSASMVLGVSLLMASGCPEPGEEGGEGWGDTGAETGEGADTEDPTGVEAGDDDVRPPPDTGDGDGDEGDDEGGDGDGDGEGEGGDGDGDGDGDPTPTDHPDRCWDRTFNGTELPALIFDNTIGRNDDLTASCGMGPAPDFQLGFVAPWTGEFTFDTTGSSFDTVVAVHPGECGTPELACNDDFIGLEGKLTVFLEHFEIVTVSVDGTGPFEEGPLKLTISEAAAPVCEPEMIVPDLPAQVLGDTTGAPDQLASPCGGAGAPERIYSFTAPGPGTYRFDTEGSALDTVLYTLDACDEAPLACNDDQGLDLHSQLEVELEGGQQLLLVVDGAEPEDAGAFVLSVHEL